MIDIPETGFQQGPGPSVDNTEIAIANQVIPLAEPAINTALARQVSAEEQRLQGMLQETQAYLDDLRGQQLEQYEQQNMQAVDELQQEISRTVRGLNQGRMTPALAGARLNSTVRNLGTRFPTARGVLSGFASSGSRSAFSSAGSLAMSDEAERLSAIEDQIARGMTEQGLPYGNKFARATYLEGVRQQRELDLENALLENLTKERNYILAGLNIQDRQLDILRTQRGIERDIIKESREDLEFTRDEERRAGSMEELLARKSLLRGANLGVAQILMRNRNADYSYDNPDEVKQQIRQHFQGLIFGYTENYSDVLGADPAQAVTMLRDIEQSVLSSIDDGFAGKWAENATAVATSRFEADLISTGSTLPMYKEIFTGPQMEAILAAYSSGNPTQIARVRSLFDLDNVEESWARTTRIKRGAATFEDHVKTVEQSQFLGKHSWEGVSNQVRQSYSEVAQEGMRDSVFLTGTGANAPEDIKTRSFNNTAAMLMDFPVVQEVMRFGDIQYDRVSKTLVLLDEQGRRYNSYPLPVSGETEARKLQRKARSDSFLSKFPERPRQTNIDGRPVGFIDRNVPFLDKDLMFAWASNIELGFRTGNMPQDGISGYKNLMRGFE